MSKMSSAVFQGDSEYRVRTMKSIVEDDLKADIKLTHNELALLTGLNRVTVTRILNRISEEKESKENDR